MTEPSDLELARATLCMKDQEIFMLNAELTRRAHDHQAIAAALERLERTTAAAIERLTRTVDRLTRSRR